MSKKNALNHIIKEHYPDLTGKGKKLAEFVISRPDKAVFMTTRKLAAEVGTSEATVVRFVRQLGFKSYALFIASLKELIDTQLTLIERSKLANPVIKSDDAEFDRFIDEDIENLRTLTEKIDLSEVKQIRKLLKQASEVNVIGARLSYVAAYYLGWTLTKIRKNVNIFKGSDRTTIDRLVFAPPDSVVVLFATSRYPNELVRIGKLAKRYKLKLVLITDSSSCPIVQFCDHHLIVPLKNIPFLGNPTSMVCLVNYLVHTQANAMGASLEDHQEKLEQAYLENDILFNY